MVQYGDNNEFVFLAREMIAARTTRNHGGGDRREVKRIIDEEYRYRTRNIITTLQAGMIAKCLLEYETLAAAGLRKLCARAGSSSTAGLRTSNRRRRASRHAAAGIPKPLPPKLDPGLGAAARRQPEECAGICRMMRRFVTERSAGKMPAAP